MGPWPGNSDSAHLRPGLKMRNKSFPGGLNTEARFEPTGNYHSSAAGWSGPLLLWKPLIYPLSQSEFYFFFFSSTHLFQNRGPYFMERRVFSLRHFERGKAKLLKGRKISSLKPNSHESRQPHYFSKTRKNQ